MTENEKLSGFLDGELDTSARAELDQRMAGDDQFKAKLSQMRDADDLMRAAYAGLINAPVPDRFIAALDTGIAAHEEMATPARVPALASNDNARRRWLLGGAMAASLAVGLLVGPQLASRQGAAGIGSVAFNGALDATPSLQTKTLASGDRITPRLSFAKAGGGYCRTFELAAVSHNSTGLACTRNGEWTIEALLPTVEAAPADAGYGVAEGPDDPGLAAVIESLRQGDPFDPAAEKNLIARQWK